MGVIDDSTLSDPLGLAPASARVDFQGTPVPLLWATYISNVGNAVLYYRSADNGNTWSYAGGWNFSVTLQEISNLHVTNRGELWLAFRTHENNRDRISVIRARGTTSSFSFDLPKMIAEPANGGTPGSVHTGIDLQVLELSPGQTAKVVVAAGTRIGGQSGVTLYGAEVASNGTITASNAMFTGTRQWLYSASSGRITPQLDFEHWGDGKTPRIPHLWVSFGRTELRVARLGWNGSRWSGPTSTVQVLSNVPAQDSMPGRWDGAAFIMAAPNPSALNTVAVAERNPANTSTTLRTTPAHPAGNIRNCTLAYNSVDRSFRVFATGTGSQILYYVDYVRRDGQWTTWLPVTATPVINGRNYSVRHESEGSAKYNVIVAYSGSPHTVRSVDMSLSYAPNAPRWQYGTNPATPPANGAAMDVTGSLLLDWEFSDPDPADAQTAWALSRQIGAGAIQYFRASDGTWQASEVKNVGGSTQRTLTTAQWVGAGGHGDPQHTYRVKVWDGSDTPSLYSSALAVIPSTKVNPTITSPETDGMTWTSDTVTLFWSVDEQTAYQVQLLDGASQMRYDSGWRSSTARTFTIPMRVLDGETYTIRLFTRNSEGLPSAVATRTLVVDYTEPPAPSLTATALSHLGLIRVVITNPQPPVINPNPSFEVDLSGWTAINATQERVNDWASDGQWSNKITPSGASTAYTQSVMVPANPGMPYTGWADVRPTTSSKPAAAVLHWYTPAGVYLTSTVAHFPVVAGTPQRVSVTGVAPVDAGQVAIATGVALDPTSADIIYVDDVRLMAGAVPLVLFNDVQRRHAGVDSITDVTIVRGVPEGGTWDDWTARSGQEYEYRAIAVGSNGTVAFGPWTA